MISIEALTVDKGGATICRVDRLEVAAGERVAIVGANGSGKTTLLRVLAGLDPDHRGRCAVAAPPDQRGYVHQEPLLFRGTVLGNVLYGLRARGRRGDAALAAARAWLDRFDIGSLGDRAVDHLSGGEVRRVALARALVLEPALLLLDEPLSDLDEQGVAQVMTALSRVEAARGPDGAASPDGSVPTVAGLAAARPRPTLVVATPSDPPPGLVDRIYRLGNR